VKVLNDGNGIRMKSNRKTVPDGNGNYWHKDKKGNIWFIQRTPYKDIPIISVDFSKIFRGLKKDCEKG
jgi:hypothetical protein